MNAQCWIESSCERHFYALLWFATKPLYQYIILVNMVVYDSSLMLN